MPTLLIWNNHMYGSNAYSGHAALSIDDKWGTAEQAASYVSWWPDHDRQIGGWGPSKPKLSVSEDLKAEGYAPDHIISLTRMNIGGMTAKWREIQLSTKSYRYLRHNCSTVVGQVLKAGSKLGSFSERNNLVWTPIKVKDLALSMGGKKESWDAFLEALRDDIYLDKSDVTVLSHLRKRDEAHGKDSSGNNAYYSNGRQVVAKPWLQWQGGDKTYKLGKDAPSTSFFFSYEGSILSSGNIKENGEKQFTVRRNVPVNN